MENNSGKIGCTTGRAKIIDPNDFDGFNASSNVPVQLEDLNISVILTTYKKPRTNLTQTDEGSTFESSREFKVNFIEGSQLGTNKKKFLTTKFTDLTTTFEKGVLNEETLGITNIDIEFNSAMAPMVTISFVDVRGSSIFQNEDEILGGYNKYAVFFQMPYPLFELEIKGYYGLPVKYCLHMLKFNSKFNSQTGNFEITCNFIGYSYAMLSDTLLGYLKVIDYTDVGSERYKEYNKTRKEPILNLNKLMIKILDINKDLQKVADSDPSSSEYNAAKEAISKLEDLENTLYSLYDFISDLNIDKTNKIYLVFKPLDLNTKQNDIKIFNDNTSAILDGENGFNIINPSNKLDSTKYKFESKNTTGIKYYQGVTKKLLTSTDANDLSKLKTILGTQENLTDKQIKLSDYLSNNYTTVGTEEKLDIIDLSDQITEIKAKLLITEKAKKESEKKLAKEFQLSVKKRLGFEPLVRNVMECFTAAVEVFIESIYQVSSAAETNNERTEELKKKFTSPLITDIDSNTLNLNKFYPWPDYREKNSDTGAYTEKYLGASGVLEYPERVNELVFIEDLLQAFREAKKEEDEAIEQSEAESVAWLASNPLDSIAFGDTSPYSRSENIAREDFVRILLIRAMTFLGYSNRPEVLKPEEIQAMGVSEAEEMLKGSKKVDNANGTLTKSLIKINQATITDVKGKINDEEVSVIKEDGSNYIYNYIYKDKDWKIIPINKGFNNENWGSPDNIITQQNGVPVYYEQTLNKKNEGYLFLTNYSDDDVIEGTTRNSKRDDGGVYIKFLKPSEFKTSERTVVAPEGVTSDNVLILEKLKEEEVTYEAGFNSFGGGYGAQDFSVMNWGDEKLKDLPLMYVFYKDTTFNGLSLTRKETATQLKLTKPETTTLFDFKNTGKINIPAEGETSKAFKDITDGSPELRLGWGKNRELFASYASASYPCVMLKYKAPSLILPDKLLSFSLFGSDLYYNQSLKGVYNKYNRALLFLHSLPFNKTEDGKIISNDGPYEVKHLFDSKAGFVHAPRLWCAYLGGILWRYSSDLPKTDSDGKIIGGGTGTEEVIAWNLDGSVVNQTDTPALSYSYLFEPASGTTYLPEYLEFTGYVDDNADYEKVDRENDIWPNLPAQIKTEFIKIFLDFVNGTDDMTSFDEIANELEIYSGDGLQFRAYLNYLQTKINRSDSSFPFILAEDLLYDVNNGLKKDIIEKNYTIMTPLSDDYNKFFVYLEIKDDSDASRVLKKALSEELIIANTNYAVWSGDDLNNKLREPISVSKENLELYIKSVIDTLQKKGDEFSPTKKTEDIDIELFGTANKDIIRLQLYRTCKNIYDKWLGGAKNINNVMYQCGGRSSIDEQLAQKYNGTQAKTKFIDSFRFVNRAFRDIGDLLYINPIPINDFLVGNPDTSAYDAMSSLLSANYFEFQPLPNFINFNNDETLKAIFRPYSYYDSAIPQGICGPSFVCVYVGQTSKHLDFRGSEYPNDGFDLRCINGSPSPTIPSDFIGSPEKYEDVVGAFTVRYGQQNQNIFKDVVLDQSEFSETDESLQVQDEISQKGAENNRSFVGQNIYNVYAVRSYSAQIDMMGNAMIQPMMYFQLDNIPMFHGAYMIVNVKHSIKPNNMSTNFKGVRIRYPDTPLITAYDVYMDLLGTIDTSGSGVGTVGSAGSTVDPEYDVIPDKEVYGKFVNPYEGTAKITSVPGLRALDGNVQQHKGVDFGIKVGTNLIAVYDGEIELVKFNEGGFGLYVVINHDVIGDKTYKTIYGHMSDLSPKIIGRTLKQLTADDINKILAGFNPKVKVLKGDVIGLSGGAGGPYLDSANKKYNTSGKSTGAHLHWELRIGGLNDKNTNVFSLKPINGLRYIPAGKDFDYGDSQEKDGCPKITSSLPFNKQTGFKNTIDKIINGTYTASSGRDWKGSFDGLKKVSQLWAGGKLTKKGVIAMSFGVQEGFGSSPGCKNPGNIRGTGCNGYKKYATWEEGWKGFLDDIFNKWVNSGLPATASGKYPNCYIEQTNKLFKESNLKYKESTDYAYKKGSKPTLRQFINVYAPWGDKNNPSNYIAAVATTLKGYGYDINVDDPMNTWV